MEMENPILSSEEKDRIRVAWNKGLKKLSEIMEFVWGPGEKKNSLRAIALKEYLGNELNLKQAKEVKYNKKDPIQLTEAHKEYIVSNAIRSKPLQLVRFLFGDEKLTPFSMEYKAVREFYDSLDEKLKMPDERTDDTKYSPPRNDTQTIARINRYTEQNLVFEKISQRYKDYLTKTSRYCRVYRFIYEMNRLKTPEERDLMESDFIKCVWNKPDLSEEDLDMYITVAVWLVDIQRMKGELETLQKYSEEQMEEKNGNINLALTTAHKELRTEIRHKEEKRNHILEKLTGARKDRMLQGGGANLTLTSFVELWREKEKRDKFIELAERRKDKLREELRDISTMEAAKFEIWGLAPEEML